MKLIVRIVLRRLCEGGELLDRILAKLVFKTFAHVSCKMNDICVFIKGFNAHLSCV